MPMFLVYSCIVSDSGFNIDQSTWDRMSYVKRFKSEKLVLKLILNSNVLT